MVGGGTELAVSEGETAVAGSGARPGLPVAGQEPAVNADKENKVMYSPAVRRIFTSCANREGSKRAARIKIWYGHCAAVSERSAGFAQPFQLLARQVFLQAQENLAVVTVEPRQFFRRQHIFVNQLFINRSQS